MTHVYVIHAGLTSQHLSFPHGTSDCPAKLTQPLCFTASFPWNPRQSVTKKPYNVRLIFVISAIFCQQVSTDADTTKATPSSGFLVALCARDSGGGSEVCEVVQTLKALWWFRNYALTRYSQWITALQTPSNYHPSRHAQHISFE